MLKKNVQYIWKIDIYYKDERNFYVRFWRLKSIPAQPRR